MAKGARIARPNPDFPQPEGETPERAKAATEAVLALAQKLHDEYVSEGQVTRDRLISEGQSHHDDVVGRATAKHDDLLVTGQAKYDELVSAGQAKHDALIAEADAKVTHAAAEREQMITEARERSTGMVAEAQERRTEVLRGLGGEQNLLEKTIEELQISERDYHDRQKSYLQGQLLALDQSDTDQAS